MHTCDNPPCCNPNHLVLGTRKDNSDDKVSKGRQWRPKGTNNVKAKLNENKVRAIRKRLLGGQKHREIADEFGVSPQTISAIRCGHIWS